ncbi:MAG: EAL domain-containing protein [Beijerinckiaceae bacterium]|nr:EAL domain-containing protein [Beijerinckiaceae bacterium]
MSILFIPIALLVLCVVGSIAFVAHSAATRQLSVELEREKHQLTQSFHYEAEALLGVLSRDEGLGDLVSGNQTRAERDRILQNLLLRQNLDYAILVSRMDGVTLAEAGEPDVVAQRARAAQALVENSRMRGMEGTTLGIGREARVVQDGTGLMTFATLPVGRNLVLVATRPINAPTLRRLATMLALPNLRVIPGRSALETSLSIAGEDSRAVMTVIWDPAREASDILADLAFFGLIGTLVVATVGVLLFRRIRRCTEELLHREAQASHEARHDALSGLPNRTVFIDALNENIGDLPHRGHSLAVLLLDLDKFKDVNDTYGHAAGDGVLVEFGARVRPLLRQTDVLARLGGDEFAILLPSVRSHLDATRLAQAIVDATNRPFTMDGIDIRIGVTIGIAIGPSDGTDSATLLRAADTALYRAKNEGRNRFNLYEHRMNEHERMRKLVDDELRGAIERDELTLVYQPQVHADTGRIASVEALVRWRHPVHGMISPAMFVAAAEERGLIVPLGEWVMRRAMRDAARWPRLRVGVNVSAVQFRQKDFVSSVADVLKECAVQSHQLELELTEGVLVEDADQAQAAMMELRALGVKLALDDFGTGYSSLIYLRRFAFDKIKIDKSFLDQMEATGESAILVHSVVHLGRALGLEVTAEGVETEEQRRFLQAVGCHLLQGYLFSKPVPAEQLDELLRSDGDISRLPLHQISAA